MRLVLDNNVLLSAAFFKNSIPDRAFEKARDSGILLRSTDTLEELVNVVNRSKFDRYLTMADRIAFVKRYTELAEAITVIHTIKDCRDPKDNKFLELALSGAADLLISGDQDLLVLHPFQNIPIISPANFLAHH